MATESPHLAAASAVSGARMNIGEVLELLHADFPTISIPKIRFLEEKGIVTPDRTSSGYRKFSHADVERLRYALLLQRDHHQPLARIVEILDAIDRGLEPPPLVDLNPTVPDVALSADGLPSPESFRRHDDLRLSRRELLKIAEIDEALLDQLEQYALVVPRRGTGHYDSDALVICTTARELADFGLEPRHLRAFKTAADREVGLVEQVLAPQRPRLGSRRLGAPRGHGLPARRALGANARDPGETGSAALIRELGQRRTPRCARPLRASPSSWAPADRERARCARKPGASLPRSLRGPTRGSVKTCAKWMSWASGSRCRRTSRSCSSAR